MQLLFTCGLLALHCSEVAYFSAASVSRPLAVALSVVLRTLDMSLSATPQLYSAEEEDCFRFQAALYLSHACTKAPHYITMRISQLTLRMAVRGRGSVQI